MTGDKETKFEKRCPYKATCVLPLRYMVAVLSFLGFANIFAMCVSLSVAVAVMVANHTVIRDGHDVQEPTEFSWSTKLQGLILSAFYYGYILTQIPGGVLARKCGGVTVLGLSVGTSGLLTLLTPIVARVHVGLLIASRITVGMAEGAVYPSGYAVWSQWAPPIERSKLAAFNSAGARFGIILSMFLSGYLSYNFGWPSIFYAFGISGMLWAAIWLTLVSNCPASQRWISAEELDYIENSSEDDTHTKDVPIPWKAILTSMPFWAIVIAQFAFLWGLYTMISDLPLYFSQRLHFSIKRTSDASALPYVVAVLVILIGGQLADYLREHHLGTGTVRKLFNSMGFLPMLVFPVAAGCVTDPTFAVVFMTLGVGLSGFANAGCQVNLLDIAPPYASILMGISNTVGTMAGIISPTLTGFITQNKSAEEWRIVFYINGIISLIGGAFYVLFSSGAKQSWVSENGYNRLATNELSEN